jgi:hypothetical protein
MEKHAGRKARIGTGCQTVRMGSANLEVGRQCKLRVKRCNVLELLVIVLLGCKDHSEHIEFTAPFWLIFPNTQASYIYPLYNLLVRMEHFA